MLTTLRACRKAFSFLFEQAEAPSKPQGLAGFFKRTAAKGASVQTEFPYNDMRGLRAIETVLQKANVINKT